jgi:hypothetical protein
LDGAVGWRFYRAQAIRRRVTQTNKYYEKTNQ